VATVEEESPRLIRADRRVCTWSWKESYGRIGGDKRNFLRINLRI